MHLLIDVRTATLSDIPFLHYGLLWADLWKDAHPHDTLTFLAHEGDLIEGYDSLHVPRGGWFLTKKKIANHAYGPDRVVSFSRLPPYDTSIPQISHVSDLSPILYPPRPLGTLEYRAKKNDYIEIFSKSRHIIIPHLDVGTGISELFSVDEEKMSVIPYLSPINNELQKHRTILPHGIYGEYFLIEGTTGEEWRPLEVIEMYATYIHRHGGKEKLIILGDLGANLGPISTMIRTLDLMEYVKITGMLSREERELLYFHAKGWIYAGSYYSRGPSVALASGYDIPLFFSDIAGLRNYTGAYFHPNHLDELPGLIKNEINKDILKNQPNNDVIMEVYTRIISE